MLIPKVKICGITNYDDAAAALEMGADLIGFNFYPKSPRYIRPEAATKIINKLPAFVDLAGVFVNSSLEETREIASQCQLDWIQLHGDEDAEFCRWLAYDSPKTMKAIRVKDARDIQQADHFFTDAIVLDAYDPGKYGGTGLTFDWNIIGHIGKRIFLAGGINPDNAVAAVELGVYGIDVCSGVEASPGKKDHQKMKRLFDNIRHLRA
ncbi:MAG TPA: phosphoribosylanthranilate isomerase [Sedimentisphaerales bacterium]|mgnify:CR=1 FL=1|nr:phosphoribosylanthranilate isomerase [Sedimentisphaerales bacterium]HRS12102.1 phosphoribosylanthranilate isomerase [Sedimentisphaerales bacterium]HRV48700.1 phosphoribosylanthranilate isomerase [Sedimentisphaerales bacterium]